MRTCKVILVILFVLMTALTCFSHFYRQESVDDTPPVLTCTEEVLEVSVNASQGSCFGASPPGMIGTETSRAKSWWITFPP